MLSPCPVPALGLLSSLSRSYLCAVVGFRAKPTSPDGSRFVNFQPRVARSPAPSQGNSSLQGDQNSLRGDHPVLFGPIVSSELTEIIPGAAIETAGSSVYEFLKDVLLISGVRTASW